MNFRLTVFTFWLLALSGCALSTEKHRDARLMPQEVAKEIIAKHTNKNWADHPQLMAASVNHPLCDDKSQHDLDYSHMKVVWDSILSIVQIFSDKKEVGFWCGSYLSARIKYSSEEDRNDIIDALVSLGAKVAVR